MTKKTKGPKKIVMRWVVVFYILVLGVAIAIVSQTVNLMLFQHAKWSSAVESPIKSRDIEPKRGDIVSSDGKLLATTIPKYKVLIDLRVPLWEKVFNPAPQKKEVDVPWYRSLFYSIGLGSRPLVETDSAYQHRLDSIRLTLDTLSRGLAKYTKYSPKQMKSILRQTRKDSTQFVFTHRFFYSEFKEIKKLPWVKKSQYIGGLRSILINERVQLYGGQGQRTIGKLNSHGRGKYGFELAFNEELAGEPGEALMQKIGGDTWMPVDKNMSKVPEDGADVVVTINSVYQDIVRNALLKQMIHTQANYGCALLMDVESGAVLSMVNLDKTKNGYKEEYNHAIGTLEVPGSTIKTASWMAALEDGYFDIEDTIDTKEGVLVKFTPPVTDDGKKYGIINMKEVLKVSSNVGTIRTIEKHYLKNPEKFLERWRLFHLNEKVGIEIIGEKAPEIKNTESNDWWWGALAKMSFGYETRFTPIQILNFYNAIANNGKLVRPQIKESLMRDGRVVEPFKVDVIESRICTRSTAKTLQEMLCAVVEPYDKVAHDEKGKFSPIQGTAYSVYSPICKIAGKTGTANLWDVKQKKFIGNQCSFVGFFPADEPRFSCIVVVNKPTRNGSSGNAVAGPAFKEIAEMVYAVNYPVESDQDDFVGDLPPSIEGHFEHTRTVLDELDLPLKDKGDHTTYVNVFRDSTKITLEDRFIPGNMRMPDLKGMCLKDAIYILENLGLKVKVDGFGIVRLQQPLKGRKLRIGQKVVLTAR